MVSTVALKLFMALIKITFAVFFITVAINHCIVVLVIADYY